MALARSLQKQLDERSKPVGVVGLGYAGLPVAVAFAEAGFDVVGVDVDEGRVRTLGEGCSYVSDVDDARIATLISTGRLQPSSDFRPLRDAVAVLICVSTPLKDGAPDLSHVIAAGEGVAGAISPETLVVLESTTYPGTTQEILQPIFEKAGFEIGEDLLLAFSPERIDPGNEEHELPTIPRVVGGVNEESTSAAASLYRHVFRKVHAVSSPREAELAKLIENTFRHVNIALVNELAIYAHEMGIDIWEAIEAAATKPFGYMPFWPGPGWGGHCIPLDPAYLSWSVRRKRSHDVRFVELAHTVNSEMPRYVVERVGLLLNEQGKSIRGARILGIGVAYKAGTDDLRGSGGIKVLERLASLGAQVNFHDPMVDEITIGERALKSSDPTDDDVDLIVIFTPQRGVDWQRIGESGVVLDCCNALAGRKGVFRL